MTAIFAVIFLFLGVHSSYAQDDASISSQITNFEQLRDQFDVDSPKFQYVDNVVQYYISAQDLVSGQSLSEEEALIQVGDRPQFFDFALRNFNNAELSELGAAVGHAESKGGAALESRGYLMHKDAILLNQ